MERVRPSDINMLIELRELHPELADRLKVVRSHIAYAYGAQCAKDIMSGRKTTNDIRSKNDIQKVL